MTTIDFITSVLPNPHKALLYYELGNVARIVADDSNAWLSLGRRMNAPSTQQVRKDLFNVLSPAFTDIRKQDFWNAVGWNMDDDRRLPDIPDWYTSLTNIQNQPKNEQHDNSGGPD